MSLYSSMLYKPQTKIIFLQPQKSKYKHLYLRTAYCVLLYSLFKNSCVFVVCRNILRWLLLGHLFSITSGSGGTPTAPRLRRVVRLSKLSIRTATYLTHLRIILELLSLTFAFCGLRRVEQISCTEQRHGNAKHSLETYSTIAGVVPRIGHSDQRGGVFE